MPITLTADSLTVVRGERRVIDSLSLTARAGEPLLLVGPNGSGKTTLLRALAGLIRPHSGDIRLATTASDADPPVVGELCHFIGHAPAVKSRLSVRENLAFWRSFLASSNPATDDELIDAALDAFGLADLSHVAAGILSAGQKRRLGLARLKAAHRPIWLLDEPTTSLDGASTDDLIRLIVAHLAAGGLLIAATHIPLALPRARTLTLDRGEAVR